MANVLNDWALVALRLGNYDEAKRLAQGGLAIRRALDDRMGVAWSLSLLGSITSSHDQSKEGERLSRESVRLFRETDNRHYIAIGLAYLGGSLLGQGRFTEAHALYQESAAICTELGMGRSYEVALSNIWLGLAKTLLGWYQGARAQGEMCLSLSREIGFQRGIAFSLLVLAYVALAKGAYADAQRLLRESVDVYREMGERDRLVWSLLALGIAARGLGQLVQAWRHLSETLQIATETTLRSHSFALNVLLTIALLLADRGEGERAVELYALASRYPYVVNSRWSEDVVGRHITTAAASLSAEAVAAAQERGRARDLDATVRELVAEFSG
jgi:tetratricopeptide (TPR) repeat protein